MVFPRQQNKNHDPNTEKKDETKSTHRFFDRIALLELNDDRKNDIAHAVLEGTFGTKLYWLEFVLSCIITVLGLLTWSIPVVIGGMLIAPILQPIKAFSFAVTTGSKRTYLKALRMLGLSVIVAVAVAYFITMVVPFADVTKEILARTSPTIVDLFIALASGIIAAVALWYRRLSESIAGVAMAVALMPPLCVIGIGLQFVNRDITLGSTLLFLTNLIAIIVVGIVTFYLFGFFPTNKKWKKRSLTMTLLILTTIAFITVPLWKGMQTIAQNFKINTNINQTFENFLEDIDPNIEFDQVEYKSIDDKTLRIKATLNVPNTVKVTDLHRQELTQHLALTTQKSVELELSLIDISSVYIDTPANTSQEERLKTRLESTIKNYSGLVLVNIRIAGDPNPLVRMHLINTASFNKKQEIEEVIKEQSQSTLWKSTSVLIQRQKSFDEEKTIVKKDPKEDEIKEHFYFLFPNAELESFLLEEYDESDNHKEKLIIDLKFSTIRSREEVQMLLPKRKDILEKKYHVPVTILTRIDYWVVTDY